MNSTTAYNLPPPDPQNPGLDVTLPYCTLLNAPAPHDVTRVAGSSFTWLHNRMEPGGTLEFGLVNNSQHEGRGHLRVQMIEGLFMTKTKKVK